MTTIAVAAKNGLAAIACDSLTKWGHERESASLVVNHEKIIQVGTSYLAFTGPTSAKTAAADYFSKPSTKAQFNSVQTIFRTWLRFHKALKSDYFLLPEEEEDIAFESTKMDVLIANPNGIFGVASHRAVQQFSQFFAYGGGSAYALGAMMARYEDPKLSAQDLVRLAIEISAEFNDETAPPVRSYEIRLKATRERGRRSELTELRDPDR